MTTTHPETTIAVGDDLPTITIGREFDAPVDRVFRAFTDPDLYAAWIGPRSITTTIHTWQPTTGGAYRWTNHRDGEEIAAFYGSFHEVRQDARIVQTQTFEPYPDVVTIETITFEALPDARTRVTSVSLAGSFDTRDAIVASGMESGVAEGYQKLDELLASEG